MKRSVLTILLLGLLLMAMVAPFSALAMLMVVVLGSAFFWTLWTMLQTLITGDTRERG
jgi:hypothetical protein